MERRKNRPTIRRERGGEVKTDADVRRRGIESMLERLEHRFPREEEGRGIPTKSDPFCGLPDSSLYIP